MMRYGFFNPWRKKMVADPFEWPWSTLRDLVGAATPVWTPLRRIARLLRTSQKGALVEVTETADFVPPLPEMKRVLVADLDGVREAVGAAMRLDCEPVLPAEARRLVVRASFEIGAPQVGWLAAELGCTTRTIRRDRTAETPGLDAVLRCISDARLRRGPVAYR
jgi:hypothetical protein